MPSIEDLGYIIEVRPFDDFVLPNVALLEGAIDLNIFQHKPYLDAYNENYSKNLKMIDKIAVNLVGLYSNKYSSIEMLPNGAKIGIYQDVSNQDRSLRILTALGLLEVKEKDGLFSLLNIQSNSKDFKFITMDINQLIKGVTELDASFVAGTSLVLAGIRAKYCLAIEKADDNLDEFAIGLVVTEENVNKPWVNDILKAFQTEKTKGLLDEAYQESFILVL